ncbi:uncharacterized protein LOC143465519 [Clavelina lepadiformis]|uniref:Uncharacterized protein n=1 Tax=Clavelina lepadiformis TaxID=159417 RepID=A0ABP0F0C4_CLALP
MKSPCCNGFNFKLVLVCLVIVVLCATDASRSRRRRCIPRICTMCQTYLHSRWRRSLPETPLLSHDGEWTEETNNLNLAAEGEFQKSFPTFSKSSYKIVQNKIQAQDLISDLTDVEDAAAFKEFDTPFPKSNHIQKRSAATRTRRCMYLVRTPCCRKVLNTVVYIGYRKNN